MSDTITERNEIGTNFIYDWRLVQILFTTDRYKKCSANRIILHDLNIEYDTVT
jgi:hypothetical protein